MYGQLQSDRVTHATFGARRRGIAKRKATVAYTVSVVLLSDYSTVQFKLINIQQMGD